MASGATDFANIFNSELTEQIPVFAGGRTSTEFTNLSKDEEAEISIVVRNHAQMMARVCPTLANILLAQEKAIIKMGGIAKALFPNEKVITAKGTTNSIVVDIVTPQVLFWDTSADSTNPCYNGYTANSWNVDLTAGTAKHLLGDGTNYYKTSKTAEQYMAAVLLNNGLYEIGTTPKISHMHIKSNKQDMYAPFALSPTVDLSIDETRPIHIYNTPGLIPLTHDIGVDIAVMPQKSGVSDLRWLGVAFYEYEFMDDISDCYRST